MNFKKMPNWQNDPVLQAEMMKMAKELINASLHPEPECEPIEFKYLDSKEKEIIGNQEKLDLIIEWSKSDDNNS